MDIYGYQFPWISMDIFGDPRISDFCGCTDIDIHGYRWTVKFAVSLARAL
jgi:hypothetical protein